MGQCWRVYRDADKKISSCLEEQDMPDAEVCVRLQWSGLNYKDALALTGAGAIMRQFPCIPGIDGMGVVERSAHAEFKKGQRVFFTGGGAGEERDGGLASWYGSDGAWLLPVPDTWSGEAIMALGTAGLTAAQGILALEKQGLPDGPVAITGATGGVGTVAIQLCVAAGREVVAVSSKAGQPEVEEFLKALGVSEVIATPDFIAGAGRALEKQRWAGGIDCTGGEPLAALIRQTLSYGSVATCGVASSAELPVGMFPFILRGVNLLGLSSVYLPMSDRRQAWDRLTSVCTPQQLAQSVTQVSMSDVLQQAEAMVTNRHRGRDVVKV